MTTTQMAYFIAMVEHLSFTEVAEMFYVTQPTLSRQIMNLETELGVQLFVRKSNNVNIASAGMELYKGLKPIYDQLTRLIASIRCSNAQNTLFTIGIAEELLLDDPVQLAIGAFSIEHPDVIVTIRRATHADIAKGIKDGSIAVADAISTSLDIEQNHFDFLLIEEEKVHLTCSRKMRETLPDKLSLEMLRDVLRHNTLLLSNVKSFGKMPNVPIDVLYEAFGPFDFEIDVRMYGSPLSVPAQVASGLGVSLSNKSSFFAIDPKTALVEIDVKPCRFTIYPKGLVYSQHNQSPLLQRFLEIAKEKIEDSSQQ